MWVADQYQEQSDYACTSYVPRRQPPKERGRSNQGVAWIRSACPPERASRWHHAHRTARTSRAGVHRPHHLSAPANLGV